MKNTIILVALFIPLSLKAAPEPCHHKVLEVKSSNNEQTLGFGRTQNLNNDQENKYCAWVNGPLVHSDGTPTGTIIDNGRVLEGGSKEWKPKTDDVVWSDPNTEKNKGNFNILGLNGVIGLRKDGTFFLKKISEISEVPTKEISWAFQNGPILVKDGVNLHNPQSQNRTYRSGMGYSEDNKLVSIVTTNTCTFYELASLFERYKVKNAIYLDGFPDESTYIGMKGNASSSHNVKKERLLLQFFKPSCDSEVQFNSKADHVESQQNVNSKQEVNQE